MLKSFKLQTTAKMNDNFVLISSLQEKINTLQDENEKLTKKLQETEVFIEKKMQIETENESLKEKVDYLMYEANYKTKELDSSKTAVNLFKQLLKYI